MSEVKDRAFEIIANQLNIPKENIKGDSKFIEDLGADSLDIVELVMALEEEFGIKIPEDDAEGILTVDDAIKYIADKEKADDAK